MKWFLVRRITTKVENFKFLHDGWQRKVNEFKVRTMPTHCHFDNASLFLVDLGYRERNFEKKDKITVGNKHCFKETVECWISFLTPPWSAPARHQSLKM